MSTRFVKSAVAVNREITQAMNDHARQMQQLAIDITNGSADAKAVAVAVSKFAGDLAVSIADLTITVSALANEVDIVGLAAGPGGHYPQRGGQTVLDDF